jgi:chromosome segregation ATPase
MNTQKNVFSRISEIKKPEQVELSVEKVELARKAPSVLNDLKKLDDKLRKAESKIDQEFMSYKKAWQNFQSAISEVANDRQRLENDVADINQAAMDLGVDFDAIDGLKEANNMSRKLDGLVSDLPRLYNEPK